MILSTKRPAPPVETQLPRFSGLELVRAPLSPRKNSSSARSLIPTKLSTPALPPTPLDLSPTPSFSPLTAHALCELKSPLLAPPAKANTLLWASSALLMAHVRMPAKVWPAIYWSITYIFILVTWTGPIGLEDVFATSKQLEKPDGSVLSFSNLVKLNEPTEVRHTRLKQILTDSFSSPAPPATRMEKLPPPYRSTRRMSPPAASLTDRPLSELVSHYPQLVS